MNEDEGVGTSADSEVGQKTDAAALFAMTLAALQAADTANDGSASRGLIESAEPMTATCTVERSDDYEA
jgi:hypothetical protein